MTRTFMQNSILNKSVPFSGGNPFNLPNNPQTLYIPPGLHQQQTGRAATKIECSAAG